MSAAAAEDVALLINLAGVTDVEGAAELLRAELPAAPPHTMWLQDESRADTVMAVCFSEPRPSRDHVGVLQSRMCKLLSGATTIMPKGNLSPIGPVGQRVDFRAYVYKVFPHDGDLHRTLLLDGSESTTVPDAASARDWQAPAAITRRNLLTLTMPRTDDEIDAKAIELEQFLTLFPGENQLTAIDPDTGAIDTCGVDMASPADHRAFFKKHYRTRGLYILPNEVDARFANKRAKKIHIKRIRAVSLDFDPPASADTSEAQAQWRNETELNLQRLCAEQPGSAPTCIVFSGRGFQLYYILETPLDAATFGAKIEAIAKAGLLAFGTNVGTQDISRLMRAPGTVNRPNAKKRKTGHTDPSPTGVIGGTGNMFTREQIEALWSPSEDAPKASKDKTPAVRAEDIDMPAVYAGTSDALKRRLKKIKKRDDRLSRLLDGDSTCLLGRDRSASGWMLSLGAYCKAYGLSATDFGCLVYGWPFAKDPEEIDARRIARDYKNAITITRRATATEEFAGDGGSGDDDDREADNGADAVASTEWKGEPEDLWSGETPITELPAGCVPKIVERAARDRARRIGVTVGGFAATYNVTLGSLISTGSTLQMYQQSKTWNVVPTFWVVLVGAPGSAKSPTMSVAMEPVRHVAREEFREWRKQMDVWELANPLPEKRRPGRPSNKGKAMA